MNIRMSALLAGSSLLVIASISGAYAASAITPSQQLAAAADEGNTEEIIVTARRKSENLQDVPQTVNAVTAAELQKLNLQNLQDISGVVPGLTITRTGGQFDDAVTLRGVSFNPNQGSQDTVAFYMNDVFVTNNFVTASNYDIGQIEVLRGPQGTLRGESAPSGAISITTHKPDLEKYGGTITGTLTHFGNVNVNGAVNVPIVQDKLALRVAGLVDKDDYNDVKSATPGQPDPHLHTYSGRASLRFEPNDNISANVMYQHLYTHQLAYGQVQGPGATGGVNVNAPANYDGPAITPLQRLGVGQPGTTTDYQDIVTGEVDWKVAGQRVTYDASWWKYALNPVGHPSYVFQAPAAVVPASPLPFTTQKNWSQELRLASDEPDRFWDYLFGVFYRHTADQVDATQLASFLPGSFGSPAGTANPNVFNPNYLYQLDIHSPSLEKEFSVYAHFTVHLPDNTELTAGTRWIDYKKTGTLEALSIPTHIGVALPAVAAGLCGPGFNLGPLGRTTGGAYGATYPGVCDFTLGQNVGLPFTSQNLDGHPWIYEASLSHKFSDNILGYLNSGSSWRPPALAVGIYNAANDPALAALTTLKAEKSYSFEGGLKTTFLDNRGRLNLAFYHQIFKGFFYTGPSTLYLQDTGSGTPTVSPFAFTSNVNSKVDGVDLDTGFQITHDWNIDGTASWANGRITGSNAPCNPPGVAVGAVTVATFTAAGKHIFECPSTASTSQGAKFSFSAQTEYKRPITDGVDGFIRGLITFQGRNPTPNASVGYVIPAYQLTNIYLGLRSPDGAWEVSAFVKNAFNTTKVLVVSGTQLNTAGLATTFGPSGYYSSGLTPPQEFGVTVTYAFGSR